MAYIEQQLVAQKVEINVLYLPAIALENFAIVIRPQGIIFEDCEAYQILHKDSGRHVATFSIAEFAIKCLQELERIVGFSGKMLVIGKGELALIRQIVSFAQADETMHPDFWDDNEES